MKKLKKSQGFRGTICDLCGRLNRSLKRGCDGIFPTEGCEGVCESLHIGFGSDCEIELNEDGTWRFYQRVGLQILPENMSAVVKDEIAYFKKGGTTHRTIKEIEQDLKYHIETFEKYHEFKELKLYIKMLKAEKSTLK